MEIRKRNTASKQLVLEELEKSPAALSQDMLEASLRGRIDRVTIYRVLNSFCEDGLVHRVMSDEGKAYYARCKGCTAERHKHEHAHFRCLGCQKVECLSTTARPRLPEGYRQAGSNFWITGYCPECGVG